MTKKNITIHYEEQFKILSYEAVDITPIEEFLALLKESYEKQRPLKIKWGADPSSSDIHIGHSVILNKLRIFQDLGHEVCFLIGDFTAMIGDPTGKNKTRPTLTEEEVKLNAKTYCEQI